MGYHGYNTRSISEKTNNNKCLEFHVIFYYNFKLTIQILVMGELI